VLIKNDLINHKKFEIEKTINKAIISSKSDDSIKYIRKLLLLNKQKEIDKIMESIILFVEETVRNNMILIIVMTMLCVAIDYLKKIQNNRKVIMVKYKPDKDIIRLGEETRIFLYINNKRYYLKNFEESNKLNKLVNLKDIVLDDENNEFYFINK
jgi:hypothetical protein